MAFQTGHAVRMPLKSDFTNLPDACNSVGSENYAEDFGHKIVIFFAVIRIFEISAIRTCRIVIVNTACPDLAPCRLLVFMASRAFVAEIFAASSAIQPAIGYQIRI